MSVRLIVNGSERVVEAPPEQTLLSTLRDDLALTGTKYGCGEGQCGACTVLVDGMAVKSCQAHIGNLAGKKITTIEALAAKGRLHDVQQAFLQQQAFQCAYCTSGMIMAAVALLGKTPHPSEQQIVQAMNGNVCRCGVYPRIVQAIQEAAQYGSSAREKPAVQEKGPRP